MSRLLPAALAALVLVLAACTVPAFDPSLALAARTFEHVPVMRFVGPMPVPDVYPKDGKPDFWLEEDLFTYLPERTSVGFDVSRGFVLRRFKYDKRVEVWYQFDIGAHWLPWSADYRTGDKMPWQWPQPLKTGPYLGAVSFEDYELNTWIVRIYADTAAATPYQYVDMTIDVGSAIMGALGLGSEPVVVGMSVNADPSATEDQLYILVRNTSLPNLWTEAFTYVSFSGFAYNGTVFGNNYPLDFLPSYARHILYYHEEESSRSFAQWPVPEGWRTWAWWGSGAAMNQKLTNVAHRIDAVLDPSAGGYDGATYLLSTEDQVGRVYRYDGVVDSLVAEFPLGTLDFIGEAFIGGVPMILFSRAVFAPTGDTLSFEIRGIETSKVVGTFAVP